MFISVFFLLSTSTIDADKLKALSESIDELRENVKDLHKLLIKRQRFVFEVPAYEMQYRNSISDYSQKSVEYQTFKMDPHLSFCTHLPPAGNSSYINPVGSSKGYKKNIATLRNYNKPMHDRDFQIEIKQPCDPFSIPPTPKTNKTACYSNRFYRNRVPLLFNNGCSKTSTKKRVSIRNNDDLIWYHEINIEFIPQPKHDLPISAPPRKNGTVVCSNSRQIRFNTSTKTSTKK